MEVKAETAAKATRKRKRKRKTDHRLLQPGKKAGPGENPVASRRRVVLPRIEKVKKRACGLIGSPPRPGATRR